MSSFGNQCFSGKKKEETDLCLKKTSDISVFQKKGPNGKEKKRPSLSKSASAFIVHLFWNHSGISTKTQNFVAKKNYFVEYISPKT